ncbi:hypothetical protein CC86DRAFT_409049 [Ophiobolus disseminans]|uniref:Peptidase S8/S53 domain-containing protein n=1 Tax=Ophiobolus disseminans TaxID=1469910 RepID=A0A6A6ZTE0_9PLEO|nr:hypothetical protein CC86DRAFT_409049 [Ophiobolus disseminans]
MVKLAFPLHLPTAESEAGLKGLSGTSTATPIAAGIAGLILEFARQLPLSTEPAIESYLKSIDGMKVVLTESCSRRGSEGSEFSYINPGLLFHYDEDNDDGGDWADVSSPRYETAQSIVRALRLQFGRTIGREMMLAVDLHRVEEKLRRLRLCDAKSKEDTEALKRSGSATKAQVSACLS